MITGVFARGQENTNPDITWGNSLYFNLNVGESFFHDSVEVKLLQIKNQFNKIAVDDDTLWIKVSRRTLPLASGKSRLFIADNANVKRLSEDKGVHGLLTKDALICVSDFRNTMLDGRNFIFPISFNDGFIWNAEENGYMYSYMGKNATERNGFVGAYQGISFDLNDARGIEKHWIVAIENSTVVWVEDRKIDRMGKEACVLLKSNSVPNIYYLYSGLYNKTTEVKKGQRLMRGELVGTAWGDEKWGHFQLSVLKSDSVPSYENRYHNSLNFFPQLFELYFKQSFSFTKSYTRGKVEFGRSAQYNQNQKNTSAFEEYLGKGWMLGEWNATDKVESVVNGSEGNARLKKVLFSDEKARCRNPKNYYDYEINVKSGVYRVRAKVGDLHLPSWQKIEFEGVTGATYDLTASEQKWTSERVVKVTDRKLTIRIYIDKNNGKVAGLSEIVFQRAY